MEDYSLCIKLDDGAVQYNKIFNNEQPGRVADKEAQDWAVKTAAAYLNQMAALAQRTADSLKRMTPKQA